MRRSIANGVVDDLASGGPGADHGGVGADTARPSSDRLASLLRRGDAVGAELEGERSATLVGFEPEHLAARGTQELHRQQAEQAEADHDRSLAERRLGTPHPLQRDRADRREGGRARSNTFRDDRDQVAGDRDDLGVVRAPGARTGDELPDAEVGDPARIQHDPGARVAERGVGRSHPAGEIERFTDAVLAEMVERLLDQLGVLIAGGQSRHPRRGHRDAFGAARDHRARLATRTQPAWGTGAGTSTICGWPARRTSCFMKPEAT